MPSPPFDPRSAQPLMPFFDIDCGGITNIYQEPTMPLSLTYSYLEGQAPTVVIVLNSSTGKKLEQVLATNAECKFQFGYLGNTPYKSKWNSVIGAKIGSKRNDNTYRVTYSGLVSGASDAITSSNASDGTIQEILDKLAKDHNITVTYSPPFGTSYMSDSGFNNNGDTSIQEKQHIKWSHESDRRFIDRILKYARDQQGRSGYIAVWGQDNNGNDTLDIRLPDESASVLTYDYPSNNVQNVIDWEPEIEILAGSLNGSTGAQVNGYEESTGNQFKSVLDPALTQNYQTTMGNPVTRPMSQTPDQQAPTSLVNRCSETMDDSVVTNSIRSYAAAGTMNSLARNNPNINSQIQAANANNKGVLTVFGDPGIDETYISKMFTMNSYYSKNYDPDSQRELDWSAGTWMINGWQHILTPGNFKTIIYCSRIASAMAAAGEIVDGGNGGGTVSGIVLTGNSP